MTLLLILHLAPRAAVTQLLPVRLLLMNNHLEF